MGRYFFSLSHRQVTLPALCISCITSWYVLIAGLPTQKPLQLNLLADGCRDVASWLARDLAGAWTSGLFGTRLLPCNLLINLYIYTYRYCHRIRFWFMSGCHRYGHEARAKELCNPKLWRSRQLCEFFLNIKKKFQSIHSNIINSLRTKQYLYNYLCVSSLSISSILFSFLNQSLSWN